MEFIMSSKPWMPLRWISATLPTKFVDLFHMQLRSIQVCLVMLDALSPSLVRGYTINFWLLIFYDYQSQHSQFVSKD
jgi:hypothetical protein